MKFTKDIVNMWRELWRTNKTLFWVGAIGTIASVIASVTLNVTVADPHMWTVLIFFTIGSVCLTYNAYVMRDSWMLVLMSWYTLINVFGISNLFLGPM